MALPLYLLTKNVIITSNLLIVFTMFFSSFSMYLFAFHLTKKVLPGILASIIFVFNPFIMARFPDQLILFSLQWIPLIFLSWEKLIKSTTIRSVYGFIFFVALSAQLLSSLYYFVFLTVVLPIYMLLRLRQKKASPFTFIHRGTQLGFVIFLLVTVFSAYFYDRVFSVLPIKRGMEQAAIYSAWPSDYLFTSPSNLLYGSLKEKAAMRWPQVVRFGIYSEQNLFGGIIPFLLLLLSFALVRRTLHNKLYLVSILLLIVSLFLSFGPSITLFGQFSVPGPYRLFYALNPLFSFLRTPARFGGFVFFFLSLICALTLSEIIRLTKPKTAVLISMLIIAMLMIEYANKPLEFTHISDDTKEFYSGLNSQKNIRVILDYPIGNLIPYPHPNARAEDLDARYLLAATVLHDKTLYNGYTGFLPQVYYDRANSLSIDFPTEAQLTDLKSWGVDAIVLHREEFNLPAEFFRIRNELQKINVPLAISSTNLAFFDLTGWKEAP